MFGDISKMLAATHSSVQQMPADDVKEHAQSAAGNLADNGKPDLANELGDVIQAAQNNPDQLRTAVVGFVEKHPETITSFTDDFKRQVAKKM
jgi:hypothetical protein